MTPEAASRFAKAERFRAQALRQQVDAAPEATIHLAYYAMLHAAASLLLERTSEVPKTHSGIIGQFSQLWHAMASVDEASAVPSIVPRNFGWWLTMTIKKCLPRSMLRNCKP